MFGCRQCVAMRLTGSALRNRRERLSLSQAKLAELTGVSQHLLSAYELGKAQLSPEILSLVSETIAEAPKVETVVRRRKRYQAREFVKAQRLQDRVDRAVCTRENVEYRAILDTLMHDATCHGPRTAKAVSLFSGCGGFSLGVAAAGFQVAGFVEIESALRKIYKSNFPHALELGHDITRVSEDALSEMRLSLGEVDLIVGGPPCQGFSLSGKRRADDPRNELFRHYLRFVDALRPKAAVLENVRLLTSMKNDAGELVKDEILAAFHAHGYKAGLFEVNAKEYGVPQHRERVLFVAVRQDLGIEPTVPPKTHGVGSASLFGAECKPFRSLADACSDLAYLESGERCTTDRLHSAVHHPQYVVDWLWDVPEGRSAHDNVDPAKRPPSGYNTTYKRQVWLEPASTVQTTFGMISGCRNVHPIATRSLTIREAARIQSFPDGFALHGNAGTIRQGIGNAVPPLLASQIAAYLRAHVLDVVEVASL